MLILLYGVLICLSFLVLSKSLDNSDKISSFLNWFSSNGGIYNSKISLQYYDDMGIGLNALDDISKNEELYYIPNHLILSYDSFIKSNNKEHINISNYFKSNDQIAIITVLLYEIILSTESFYFPYINILPNDIPNLSFFSSEELKQLQHLEIENSAISTQSNLLKIYQEIFQYVSIYWSDNMIEKVNYNIFLWANAIIDSRGLRFQGKTYLVPFADMVNYYPHNEIREQNNGKFFLDHHILLNDGIKVLSDRNTLKSNQIFEDYGDNSDIVYLLYHGFVPTENPFRCIKTVAPMFNTLSSNILPLIKLLKFQSSPSQCIDQNYLLNKPMSIYLSTLAFNKKEIKNCAKVTNVTSPVWSEVFDKCGYNHISTFITNYINYRKRHIVTLPKLLSNESKIDNTISNDIPIEYKIILDDSKSLQSRVLKAIQLWISLIHPSFPTTINDDISILWNNNNDTLNNHIKLAVLYRLQYKIMWYNLCTIYNSNCPILHIEQNENENENEENENIGPNVLSEDALSLEKKIDRFNYWYNNSIELILKNYNYPTNYINNKLIAKVIPNYRIGVIALSDIEKDEIYHQIPIDMVLNNNIIRKNENHPLYPLIQVFDQKFKGRVDIFHELLLLLLYEKYIMKSDSLFFPYLALLPTPSELIDIPIYWSDEAINERLSPSYVKSIVLYYHEKVIKSYEFIIKIPEILDYISYDILSFENYRWATAILDSRSIWWDNNRHLVPMLDFINCIEDYNNPSRVHSTVLNDEIFVITKAPKNFQRNEQIFENYGQPNYIYFQYHGFTLTSNDNDINKNTANSHDCVHYEFILSKEEGIKIDFSERIVKSIVEKLRFRSRAMYTSCLTYPIEENVWLMLSLKMNNYKELAKNNELGQPNYYNIKYLQNLISDRFPLYENYSSRHYESRKFINSEYKLLKWIYQELDKSLIKYLDDINDEL